MSLRSLAASSLVALLAAMPALAQDTEAEAPEATDAPAPAPAPTPEAEGTPEQAEPATPPGEGEAAMEAGTIYIREVYTDWELRCERAPQGEDPCQLFQLLRDDTQNAVAEIAVFKVPQNAEGVAAGVTVVTPLRTFLIEPLRLSVDGGDARELRLQFCAEMGCVVQFGLSQAEVQAFQRGAAAELTLVPAIAADRREELRISLSGFTAGYDALQESAPAIDP